jgi:hypothetical protein
MSRSSRSDPSPETAAMPPDIDTQPVEPPPSPPGGDGVPYIPPRVHRAVGAWEDFTSTGVVRGWALDPDWLEGSVEVFFYVDGLMSAATYAGPPSRANLPGKPGTQGENHAFSWRIPDRYRDGQQHILYAYAIDFSGFRGDSPLIGQKDFLLPPGNALPLGALEQIDGTGLVKGWALDPNAELESLTVSFYVDSLDKQQRGVFAGQVLAHLPRPDVNELTGCRGGHGFEWAIPPQLYDGLGHTLQAYATDTTTQASVELAGSPKTFLLKVSEEK